MKRKISLIKLLNEVSKITTDWIRKKIVKKSTCGEILPLIEHALISTVPGNDRALMVKLGCELLREEWQVALPAMAAWELLNINLIVTDDFFDKRTTKRMGKKTICAIWGEEACLSLGFVLNSMASEALISAHRESSNWNLRDALEILEWATKWLYYSQFQENQMVKTPLSQVTLEMYIDMIKNATSVGIAGAFELGCVMGRGNRQERKNFRDFGIYLGHLAQIRDDLIDYIYDESLIKKGAFNDLFSKKRRLPILVAYWEGTPTEKKCIEKILGKDVITLEDASVITDMITSDRIEKKIRRIVKPIATDAIQKLRLLPNTQPAKLILSELVDLFMDL